METREHHALPTSPPRGDEGGRATRRRGPRTRPGRGGGGAVSAMCRLAVASRGVGCSSPAARVASGRAGSGATSPGLWLEDYLSHSIPKQVSLTTSRSQALAGDLGDLQGQLRSVPRGVRALSPAPGRPGFAVPCDRLDPQLCPCGNREPRGLEWSLGPEDG